MEWGIQIRGGGHDRVVYNYVQGGECGMGDFLSFSHNTGTWAHPAKLGHNSVLKHLLSCGIPGRETLSIRVDNTELGGPFGTRRLPVNIGRLRIEKNEGLLHMAHG